MSIREFNSFKEGKDLSIKSSTHNKSMKAGRTNNNHSKGLTMHGDMRSVEQICKCFLFFFSLSLSLSLFLSLFLSSSVSSSLSLSLSHSSSVSSSLSLSLSIFLTLFLSLSVSDFQAGIKELNSTISQLTNFNGTGFGVCLGNAGERKKLKYNKEHKLK